MRYVFMAALVILAVFILFAGSGINLINPAAWFYLGCPAVIFLVLYVVESIRQKNNCPRILG